MSITEVSNHPEYKRRTVSICHAFASYDEALIYDVVFFIEEGGQSIKKAHHWWAWIRVERNAIYLHLCSSNHTKKVTHDLSRLCDLLEELKWYCMEWGDEYIKKQKKTYRFLDRLVCYISKKITFSALPKNLQIVIVCLFFL